MRFNHSDPLNLGSDRLVTINELVDIVCQVAGKTVTRRHDLSKPQGVRGSPFGQLEAAFRAEMGVGDDI